MTSSIQALTDDQARQAAKHLFDIVPAGLWEGGRKPSQEAIRTMATALQEESAPLDRPALEALLLPKDPQQLAAQAGMARLVLTQAEQSPALAPYCSKAIELARTPHMGIDPITGSFVIMMLLCTTRISKTEHGFKVELGAAAKDIIGALKLPELVAQLPAVIKALPAPVVSGLLSK